MFMFVDTNDILISLVRQYLGLWILCINKFGKTMIMFVDTNDVLLSLVRQYLCLWIRMLY